MLRILTLMIVVFITVTASAQDAVDTDGDKYRIILENECVRVLDYKDEPGARTSEHRHPPFVLYALSPFKRTITLPSGKVLVREFEVGDIMWSDAQTHIGENVGETPTHVVLMELKGTGSGSSKCNKK